MLKYFVFIIIMIYVLVFINIFNSVHLEKNIEVAKVKWFSSFIV